MKKYNLAFEIFKTEEQAKAFCERENKMGNRYKKENRTAHYTPRTNSNKTENGFIAWYYI